MELKAYFQSYEKLFWEWKTDEDVPVIPVIMKTISSPFPSRSHSLQALSNGDTERASACRDGLPFGALLMVLYAMQDGYTDFAGPLRRTAEFYSGEDFEFNAEKQIEFL